MVDRLLCKQNVVGSNPIISILFLMQSNLQKNRYTKQFGIIVFSKKSDMFVNSYQQNKSPLEFSKKKKTQLINRCVISGRSRAVFRMFKLSRIQLRSFIKAFSFSGL